MFPTREEFVRYLWKNGENNKYVGVLFVERIDKLENNYILIKAPDYQALNCSKPDYPSFFSTSRDSG